MQHDPTRRPRRRGAARTGVLVSEVKLLPAVSRTEAWQFPVDTSVRRRLFVADVFSHPAKLHLGLLQKLIDKYTYPGETILDPMAGSGSLMVAATQQRNVILRELQPEYVALIQASVPLIHRAAGLFGGLIDIDQANAMELECPPFDHVIFSPPYGFENGTKASWEKRKQRLLKVNHDARWWRKFKNATSDKFCYEGGRQNSGNKSGRNYWNDMRQIYTRVIRLTPSGGLIILVVKNHYRRGGLIDVVNQTVTEVQSLGPALIAWHGRLIDNPSLWQRRRKEQGQPIVEVEDVLVFRK